LWKQKLLELTSNLNHPAWGIEHFERNYNMSMRLAKEEGVEVDEEALYAASYLHDIAAFEPYIKPGIDHAVRAAEIVEDMLFKIEFPLEKVSLVIDIIKGHSFYDNPSSKIESIIFHDADTLDFMGYMGIIRLASIVGMIDWAPNLKWAVGEIRHYSKLLPKRLHTSSAKKIGEIRKNEMIAFLSSLEEATFDMHFIG
jgi:uncharacterized protein